MSYQNPAGGTDRNSSQKACGHNFDDEIEIDDSLTYVFLRGKQPPSSPSPLPRMSSSPSKEPSSGDHHSGTSTRSRQHRGRHGGTGDALSEISAITMSSSSSSNYNDPALQSDFAGSILMQEQRGIRSPATAAAAGAAATYRGMYNDNISQGQRKIAEPQHNNNDRGSSRGPSASYFTSSPPPAQSRGPGSRHGRESARQEWAPFISSPLARHSETVTRQSVPPQSESQSRQHNRPLPSPASVRAPKRGKYHATVEDASDHDPETLTRVTALGGGGGSVGSRSRHPPFGRDRAVSVFSSAPVRPVPNQLPQGQHQDDTGEWNFVKKTGPGGGQRRSQDRSRRRRSVVPSAAARPAPARPAPARASVARKTAQHHKEQEQDQQQRQREFLAVPQIKSIVKRVREILREADALAVQLRGQAVGARSAFVESTRGRVTELRKQLVGAEEAMASIAKGFDGVEELDLAHDDLFGAWFGWADG